MPIMWKIQRRSTVEGLFRRGVDGAMSILMPRNCFKVKPVFDRALTMAWALLVRLVRVMHIYSIACKTLINIGHFRVFDNFLT
jgi:hypothetical protein